MTQAPVGAERQAGHRAGDQQRHRGGRWRHGAAHRARRRRHRAEPDHRRRTDQRRAAMAAGPGRIALNGVGGSITVTGPACGDRHGAGHPGGQIEVVTDGGVNVRDRAARCAPASAGGGTSAVGTTLARARRPVGHGHSADHSRRCHRCRQAQRSLPTQSTAGTAASSSAVQRYHADGRRDQRQGRPSGRQRRRCGGVGRHARADHRIGRPVRRQSDTSERSCSTPARSTS